MKVKIIILVVLIIGLGLSCQTKVESSSPYLRMVGDILSDPTLDEASFELCNDEKYAVQYYAFTSTKNEHSYTGGGYALKKHFNEKYSVQNVKKETGLVRIRFMVNCKGETGRFRVIGMDSSYQEKVFDASISDQLLRLVKELKGWKPFVNGERTIDYYQYLIFKIQDGKIIEILP